MRDVKEELLEAVNEFLSGGPKRGTELVTELVSYMQLHTHSHIRINAIDFISELIENNDIVEVEYTLPSMPYRIKSLYFPKGTTGSWSR